MDFIAAARSRSDRSDVPLAAIMAALASMRADEPAHATTLAASEPIGTSLEGEQLNALFSSMRKRSTDRVLRRSWTERAV
jgi:hypothetical protein